MAKEDLDFPDCELLQEKSLILAKQQHEASADASLSTLSATEISVTDFPSSVVLIGAGAPFCQLLVAAGQQDGLQQWFPQELIFSLSCAKLCT